MTSKVTTDVCVVSCCASLAAASLGMCHAHYRRQRLYGDPSGGQIPRATQFADYFAAFVQIEDIDECWLWTGTLDSDGYAIVCRADAPHRSAYRTAYFLAYGEVPAGMQVDHTCHNGTGCRAGRLCLHRRCVNPQHLEAVPPRVNTLRSAGLSAVNARKTHCLRDHPLKGANLRISPDGKRICRECERTKRLRRAARERAIA